MIINGTLNEALQEPQSSESIDCYMNTHVGPLKMTENSLLVNTNYRTLVFISGKPVLDPKNGPEPSILVFV
jgi:hypothetical protein